ncbi:MAG: VCBS domain-containing protein [Scytolyngbya sp. HA4215-MV1]|jgi:VCBS repeat-containing protein|nr:VCBS domain-containing protein [Scytolyngbya sp. HA4215-MV1]
MADNAGNTLNTARALNLTFASQTFSDAVSSADPLDYYRFRLSSRSSFSLSLTNLSGDANVELLDSSGAAVVIGGATQSSTNLGTLAESINTILNAGVYYIRVTPAIGASTNYSLNIRALSSIKNDLLWRNYTTGKNVAWQMSGTVPTATLDLPSAVPDPNWRIETTGDFNGDGQSDILWRNLSTGANLIWQVNGTVVTANIALPSVTDPNWRIQATGDFTKDGQTDIVWRNQATGATVIWQMNGTTAVNTLPLNGPTVDPSWRIQGAADFTQDGQADIVWRNYTTGVNVLWSMNGNTPTGTLNLPAQTDTNWQIAGVGDYTGDGQPDIVWRNYATGNNAIWQMNGTALAISTTLQQVPAPDWQLVAPLSRSQQPGLFDIADNAPTTAPFVIGNLNGSGSYRDFVGDVDPIDFYQFTLTGPADVSLVLKDLAQNADIQILDGSGNPLTPPAVGTNAGNANETLVRTLTAGTYFIRVAQAATGQNTNYTLQLSANSIPVVVNNLGLTVDEGAPATTIANTLLQFSDANNPPDQVTYTLSVLPTKGILRLNGTQLTIGQTFTQADIDAGRLSYLNDGTEAISDKFQFTVSDGIVTTPVGPVTFNITITPVNDPPVLGTIVPITVNEGAPAFVLSGVNLPVTDVDNSDNQIRYIVKTIPTRGSLLVNGVALAAGGSFTKADLLAGKVAYLNDGNEATSDSFVFSVTDGAGGTIPDTTFNITINPVNDVPVLSLNTGFTIVERQTKVITNAQLNITDPDNSVLQRTYIVTDLPDHGTLFLRTPTGVIALILGSTFTQADIDTNGLSYAHNGNQAINDSFSFNITDGVIPTPIGPFTFGITITSIDDPPIITTNTPLAVLEGNPNPVPLQGFLVATDPDSSPAQLLYTIKTAPIHGTLYRNTTVLGAGATFTQAELDSGAVRYQHDGTETLTDSFLFDLSDGTTTLANKTFTFAITPVNDAPVLTVPGAQSVAEDTSLTFSGISIADDAGTNPLTVTLSVTNGTLTLGSALGLTITNNGSASVTVSGSLTALNAAFNTLSYKGGLNFNGADTLTINVNDGGFTGGGPGLTDTKSILLTITPVNDAPTLTVPAAQVVNEDTDLPLAGITIADVDANSNPVQVTLAATNGLLTLNPANLTFTTGDGAADETMTFTGTLAAITAALATLVYRGKANYNGTDTITITIDDLGNTGGSALTASKTIAVTINPINDPPIITVPIDQSINEDTNLTISGISISDADAGNGILEVSLSVAQGVLTLSSFNGLSFITGDGTADSNLVFRGTLADINTALNNLIYRGKANYNGADTLTIGVNDRGNTGGAAQIDQKVINLTINSVNDAPVLTTPASVTVAEDTPISLAGITLADIDAGSGQLLVTLTAANGQLTLSSLTGLTFTTGDGTSDSSMTFTGSLSDIQAALAGLTYQGNLDFNGADIINLSVDDQGNTGGAPLSTSKTINVNVTAVNDAPAIVVPTGGVTVDEDAIAILSGISITDIDALSGTLRVSLSVAQGLINLSSVTGLTFTAGSNGSKSMTFTGTLANINTALNDLTYRGDANFNGTDTLNLSVSDLGSTGAGGAKTDSDTLNITINAVDDAPVITVPGAKTVAEDTDLVISGINVNDVDSAAGQLVVTLSAANGVLTLSALTGLTFTVGDGTADGSMTFTGTLANIKAALTNLRYRGNQDFNGADTITLAIDDQGNTGVGGPLSDTKTIAVTVTPTNDAPIITVPAGPQNILEDLDLIIGGISIADVDAGLSAVKVTLSVTHGVITLSSINGLTFTAGDGTDDSVLTFTGNLTDINTALNNLTYRGVLNFFGNDTLSINVNDQGNTGSGGAKSDLDTIAIVVAPDNDPPLLVNNNPLFVVEGKSLKITGSLLKVTDAEDAPGQITYTLQSAPSNGSLRRGTTILNSGDTFTQADIDAGLINYLHLGGENTSDGFVFTVSDSAGSSIPATPFSITVSPVNDVPTLLNLPVTVNENGNISITSAFLKAIDPDNTTAQLVYTLTRGPLNGSLRLGTTTLTNGSTFTQADIDAGRLSYFHNGSETTIDNFTFTLTDGSGGNIGTTAFTINVTPQPDPPVLTTNIPLIIDEGGALNISDSFLKVTDPDTPASAIVYTLTVLPANGILKKNGVALAINDTFTQEDISLGRITYVHNGDENISDFFRFNVTDGTTPPLNNRTFSITINPVNDAPLLVANQELTIPAVLFAPVAINNNVLQYSDVDNTPVQVTYTINQAPTYGVLKKAGVALATGSTFTQQDIDQGLISYELITTPLGNDFFKFTVSDGGVGGTLSSNFFFFSFI